MIHCFPLQTKTCGQTVHYSLSIATITISLSIENLAAVLSDNELSACGIQIQEQNVALSRMMRAGNGEQLIILLVCPKDDLLVFELLVGQNDNAESLAF